MGAHQISTRGGEITLHIQRCVGTVEVIGNDTVFQRQAARGFVDADTHIANQGDVSEREGCITLAPEAAALVGGGGVAGQRGIL